MTKMKFSTFLIHLGPLTFWVPQGNADHVSTSRRDLDNSTTSFSALVKALEVMQTGFWDPSASTWPTGIDWTRATINTHVSTALATMATYQDSTYSSEIQEYVSQVAAFFTG